MAITTTKGTEAQVDALISKIETLAVLPHVVYKVLEITSSDSSAMDIERAVLVDPGFCSKILSLANSAAYGASRHITTIHEAVLLLGFKAVRSLALTVGVFDLFVGKTDKESLRHREWWRRSIDTAICARWLSRRCRTVVPEEAYICGLLHLIGKTLLDRSGGPDYEKVLMVEAQGVPDILAERTLYGCDHVAVAVAATAKWGLPSEIASGLNYLSPPDEGDESAKLRAVVALSSRIACRATDGHLDGCVFPSWATHIVGITSDELDALIPEAVSEILAARSQG